MIMTSLLKLDLCETVATQMNNITKVEVFLVDVNDQQPQFVADSLLAAVAEEAEFDTTVTVLKVTHTHTHTHTCTHTHACTLTHTHTH